MAARPATALMPFLEALLAELEVAGADEDEDEAGVEAAEEPLLVELPEPEAAGEVAVLDAAAPVLDPLAAGVEDAATLSVKVTPT